MKTLGCVPFELSIKYVQYNVEGYSPIKVLARYKYFKGDFPTMVTSNDFKYSQN